LSRKNRWFPQVRPSAWGCAGRHRRSTCGLSLHTRPNCKQEVCKVRPESPQRADFSAESTQEISRKRRLSLVESAGPLASQWAAKRPRRLFPRRRGRFVSSVAARRRPAGRLRTRFEVNRRSPLGCRVQPRESESNRGGYFAARNATLRFKATPAAGWNE
jgi:hypothetical protein